MCPSFFIIVFLRYSPKEPSLPAATSLTQVYPSSAMLHPPFHSPYPRWVAKITAQRFIGKYKSVCLAMIV